MDAVALLEEAKKEGVTFVAGPDFMIEGGELEHPALVRAGAAPSRFPRASSGSLRALEKTRSASPA